MSTPELVPVVSIREQILDAAVFCFLERGYVRTTVDDIAARSGLSTAEIHYHFADTAEIHSALFEVWSELFSGWMASA